jgi:hypothetical protein
MDMIRLKGVLLDAKLPGNSTLDRALECLNRLPVHGLRNRSAADAYTQDGNKQLAVVAAAASKSAKTYTMSPMHGASRHCNLS